MHLKEIEKTNHRQTIYECDFDIFKSIHDLMLTERIEYVKGRLKDEYEYVGNGKSTRFILVSDAHTHSERLVFPLFEVQHRETKEKHLVADRLHIAGELTMMIHGGDSDTFLEPEEYTEQLYNINKEFNE